MTIVRSVLDAVLLHACEAMPNECCGVLIGRSGRILDSARARNLAASPTTRFLLDPASHIDARRGARARGLDVIGFYHSHPHSAPFPSDTDVAEWTYTDHVQLIVGVRDEKREARLFRLVGGETIELALMIEEGDNLWI